MGLIYQVGTELGRTEKNDAGGGEHCRILRGQREVPEEVTSVLSSREGATAMTGAGNTFPAKGKVGTAMLRQKHTAS